MTKVCNRRLIERWKITVNRLHQTSPLVRVSMDNPCPVCVHPNWCSYSEDGLTAICMRVADGAVSRTKNNGYYHVIRKSDHLFTSQHKQSKPQSVQQPIAPI